MLILSFQLSLAIDPFEAFEFCIYRNFAINEISTGNGFKNAVSSINTSLNKMTKNALGDKEIVEEKNRVEREYRENVHSAKNSLIEKTGRKSFKLAPSEAASLSSLDETYEYFSLGIIKIVSILLDSLRLVRAI